MPRRRNHTGSEPRLRPDGRWQVNIWLPDGRRHSVYGPTPEAAQRRADQVLARGTPPAAERLKVRDFLEAWLEHDVRPRRRPWTYRTYQRYVDLHLVPALGHLRLARLGPQHVDALLAAKLQAGLAPRTVAEIRNVLRAALNRAVKWELIARNVAALVDPPAVPQYEPRVLQVGEAGELLAALHGDRLEALYRVALSLGLRMGEALGLRWQDVDFDAREVRLAVQLQRRDGRTGPFELVPLKTKASRRAIALPSSLAAALAEHQHRQRKERLAAGPRWADRWGLVFTTSIGTPLDGRNVVRTFQRRVERAGLGHLRFHDLRHSAGSLLLAQGVDLKTVQAILGHASYVTTANVYAHVLDESKRAAASRMDELLERWRRAAD